MSKIIEHSLQRKESLARSIAKAILPDNGGCLTSLTSSGSYLASLSVERLSNLIEDTLTVDGIFYDLEDLRTTVNKQEIKIEVMREHARIVYNYMGCPESELWKGFCRACGLFLWVNPKPAWQPRPRPSTEDLPAARSLAESGMREIWVIGGKEYWRLLPGVDFYAKGDINRVTPKIGRPTLTREVDSVLWGDSVFNETYRPIPLAPQPTQQEIADIARQSGIKL